ncbi:MAG: hypothetical protein IIY62_03470 [Kiritimatiellae bacterium]|nr:hypothetical protein [Kiritimatiellia bacterium]
MKTLKMAFAALAGAMVAMGAPADEASAAAAAKAAPKDMKLMIAGFGTIESMTKVEEWLGEQLHPVQKLDAPPTLSEGDKGKDPCLDRAIVRLNWQTRKLEYLRNVSEIDRENAENRRLLNSLRMKVLANDATRYVPLAKDYLQASLSRKAGPLVKVIDRSNADMAAVEKEFAGEGAGSFAGAGCILTAVMGDREEDSKTIPVNARVKVRRTTYTQPYTFKVRDLRGNVLLADKGTATWEKEENTVVKSETSDPARKLVEAACDQIADAVTKYFTVRMAFKVKAPEGKDADDADVKVDGKTVPDVDGGMRVLAVEHSILATLDGCRPINRSIAVDDVSTGKVVVKLAFKADEKKSAGDAE